MTTNGELIWLNEIQNFMPKMLPSWTLIVAWRDQLRNVQDPNLQENGIVRLDVIWWNPSLLVASWEGQVRGGTPSLCLRFLFVSSSKSEMDRAFVETRA